MTYHIDRFVMSVVPMNPPEDEPDNLSEARARQCCRTLAEDTNNIVLTMHCKGRMKERDITMHHILRCLRGGYLSEQPHRNMQGNWQFNMCHVTAGAEVEIGVAIDWPSKLIILTAIRRKG